MERKNSNFCYPVNPLDPETGRIAESKLKPQAIDRRLKEVRDRLEQRAEGLELKQQTTEIWE